MQFINVNKYGTIEIFMNSDKAGGTYVIFKSIKNMQEVRFTISTSIRKETSTDMIVLLHIL